MNQNFKTFCTLNKTTHLSSISSDHMMFMTWYQHPHCTFLVLPPLGLYVTLSMELTLDWPSHIMGVYRSIWWGGTHTFTITNQLNWLNKCFLLYSYSFFKLRFKYWQSVYTQCSFRDIWSSIIRSSVCLVAVCGPHSGNVVVENCLTFLGSHFLGYLPLWNEFGARRQLSSPTW